MKHPKDLGVKFVSKQEAFWTKIKERCEAELESLANEILLNKELLKVARVKIMDEKNKK